MSEIDFKNLGILPNDALLDRITSALNEINALGNLKLHAAWLYFGGSKPAAKALGVSRHLFSPSTSKQDSLER